MRASRTGLAGMLTLTLVLPARSGAAQDQDKDAATAEIAERWQGSAADGGRELRAALARLGPDRLLSARAAKTPAELNAAILNLGDVDPEAGLGDPRSHLVFFPVTPCRILDTRLAGGRLVPGVPRNFDSQGPFTAQGGSNTNCNLPFATDVAALAITLVAVDPQGAGNLRAWPKGQPVPTAVAVNYGLPGQGLSLANTTIVPLFQDLLDPLEFSVQANASAVDVVGDVVGYFDAANVSNVVEGSKDVPVTLTDACVEITSCTVTNPNAFERDALVIATAAVENNHKHELGATPEVITVNLSSSSTPDCAVRPIRPGGGAFIIPTIMDTAVFEGNIPVAKAFPVAFNSSLTIRMYARANAVVNPQSIRTIFSAAMQCYLP